MIQYICTESKTENGDSLTTNMGSSFTLFFFTPNISQYSLVVTEISKHVNDIKMHFTVFTNKQSNKIRQTLYKCVSLCTSCHQAVENSKTGAVRLMLQYVISRRILAFSSDIYRFLLIPKNYFTESPILPKTHFVSRDKTTQKSLILSSFQTCVTFSRKQKILRRMLVTKSFWFPLTSISWSKRLKSIQTATFQLSTFFKRID